MDWFQYVKILKQGLLGTLHDYNLNTDSIYFQHNGDPKHTSQHVMELFESQGINLLLWSGQLAGLKIIEPAWGHLDKQVCKWNPLARNLDELWDAFKEEWDNLDTEYIMNLYHSTPHHLQAVRDAKGSYTKY